MAQWQDQQQDWAGQGAWQAPESVQQQWAPVQQQAWQAPQQSGGAMGQTSFGNQAWSGSTEANQYPQPQSGNWARPMQPGGQIPSSAQQQQQVWPPNAFNPAAFDLGNPMLNVGLQAGAHMVQEQAENAAKLYMPGVSSFWGDMKKYFFVDNVFVRNKLSSLLFPFAKKNWERSSSLNPPALDQNSPDLYIPLMALSTYVLTVGLAKGTSMKFNPEIIVDTFGTSIMVQVVQVVLLRVAMMVFVPWATTMSWVELFAISGYEFVGVAINMVVGLLFGSFFYNISLLWTATCAAFVTTQTMRFAVPPPEPGQRGKRRRVNFFIVAAVLQVLVMWFLGYTRELRSGGVFLGSGVASVSDIPSGIKVVDKSAIPMVPRGDTGITDSDELLSEETVVERKPRNSREADSVTPNQGKRQRNANKRGRSASGDSADV